MRPWKLVLFVDMMAGDTMAGVHFSHFGSLFPALLGGVRTASMEDAALELIGILGQFAGQG